MSTVLGTVQEELVNSSRRPGERRWRAGLSKPIENFGNIARAVSVRWAVTFIVRPPNLPKSTPRRGERRANHTRGEVRSKIGAVNSIEEGSQEFSDKASV